MAWRKFPAKLEKLDEVISFAEDELLKLGAAQKIVAEVDVALEEVFVNIAHYAYPGCEGEAEIEICTADGGAEICVTDSGIAFDPLARKDPDVSLSSDERDIGGLGIYIVKKMMDNVSYKRENGRNILNMRKRFQ